MKIKDAWKIKRAPVSEALPNTWLIRERESDQGTEGRIVLRDGSQFFTLELPDRDNAANISRIPAGEYIVKPRESRRFGLTYHVQNVPDRSYILFHWANFAGDREKGWQSHLRGCVALGMRRGAFQNKYGKAQRAVLASRAACGAFMDRMAGRPFRLHVIKGGL